MVIRFEVYILDSRLVARWLGCTRLVVSGAIVLSNFYQLAVNFLNMSWHVYLFQTTFGLCHTAFSFLGVVPQAPERHLPKMVAGHRATTINGHFDYTPTNDVVNLLGSGRIGAWGFAKP